MHTCSYIWPWFWTEVPWRPSQRAISFSKLYCTCTWETSHILNWDRWITDHCAMAMGRAVAHSFRRKVWTLIVKSHCGELWNAIDHQLRASFGLAVAYVPALKSHFKSSLLATAPWSFLTVSRQSVRLQKYLPCTGSPSLTPAQTKCIHLWHRPSHLYSRF